MRGSRSYLSQCPLRATFGLGSHNRIDKLEIRWPAGCSEHFGPLAANQIATLVEGQGVSAAADPP